MQFHQRFKDIREDKDLNQTQMGILLGMTHKIQFFSLNQNNEERTLKR